MRKDGSYAQVLDQAFIIRDEGDRPLRMVGAIRDQTESIDYQQKLAEQAALLDKARDAILVHDLDHRVLFWNQGAARLYGWSSDEAVGQPVQRLYHGHSTHFLDAVDRVLADGEWSGQISQQRRDGRMLTVNAKVRRVLSTSSKNTPG